MRIKQFDRVKYVGPPATFENIDVGGVGFVLEIYDEDAMEVEFSRADGTTYALQALPTRYLKAKPEP